MAERREHPSRRRNASHGVGQVRRSRRRRSDRLRLPTAPPGLRALARARALGPSACREGRVRSVLRRGQGVWSAGRVSRVLLGTCESAHGDPWCRRPGRPHRVSRRARRHESRDADAEPRASRGRASCSSVRATRSTSARVSASSSLRAANSTACAEAASGARTRSLTVVSVSSAIRRSRGREGVVTPRSQRETVIDSTPSASASCFWVRPALRRATRSRPPTPPLSRLPN